MGVRELSQRRSGRGLGQTAARTAVRAAILVECGPARVSIRAGLPVPKTNARLTRISDEGCEQSDDVSTILLPS